MSLPLVSVVLPSCNHVDFVTTAVESVLNQHMTDFELIIVDDGSTDGTPEKIGKIHDPRIQLIQLEQNRLRHPRNIALGLAKGCYIAFQNSDDEWLPDKLHAQIDILAQHKGLVACFTNVELIGNHNEVVTSSWGNGLFTTENRTNLAWLRHFFTRGNCLCISSAMVRSTAIKKVGNFRGSLIQLSDFDLWVRLAAIGNFHIIDEKLTRMRIISGKPVKSSNTNAPDHRPRINLSDTIRRLATRILPLPIKSKLKMYLSAMGSFEDKLSTSKGGSPLVSGDNLSAPKVSSKNRTILEFADVLGNFTRPPIIAMIPYIFEEAFTEIKDSMYIQQAWLARYAWSLSSISHSIFADRIMASIMENEQARKKVTDVFGAEIIREFVRRRGQLSIRIDHGAF